MYFSSWLCTISNFEMHSSDTWTTEVEAPRGPRYEVAEQKAAAINLRFWVWLQGELCGMRPRAKSPTCLGLFLNPFDHRRPPRPC